MNPVQANSSKAYDLFRPVNLRASTTVNPGDSIDAFTNRAAEDIYLSNMPNAWFQFDFRDALVTPVKISFRQRPAGIFHPDGDLVVSGSVNGIAWDTLATLSAAQVPDGGSAWVTFDATSSGDYRYIRFMQTINTFFTVCEVEIYGALKY